MTRTVTAAGTLGALTDLDLPSIEWPGPGFSMTGDGEFVVTHVSYLPRDLGGTRFDPNHAELSQYEIASDLRGMWGSSRVAHEGTDSREFIVVWEEPPQGDSSPDIRARIFSQTIFLNGFETGDTSAWSGTIP